MNTPRPWPLLLLVVLNGCGLWPRASTGTDAGLSTAADGGPRVDVARSTLVEVSDFGTNPGAIRFFVYVPAKVATTNAAVVVAMHGCLTSAADYQAAGWNSVAEERGFVVVYPQTSKNNNCFGWYDPQHNQRGLGEALSIRQMVEWVSTNFGTQRAFVTGLSAGAAMTQVMLATYPDVFSAGASMAGVPYGCSVLCPSMPVDLLPQQWGDAVRIAGPAGAPHPKVMIWQGTADTVVIEANAPESVLQWTSVNGLSSTETSIRTEGVATVHEYADANHEVRVEWWNVAGMGHGTAVATGCGQATWYTFDVGLCSTTKAADFFGL